MSEPPEETKTKATRTMDELWRRALGIQLREMRLVRGERLDDTAARAGISPQYLSEVERGRKDASSEMIAAIVGALQSSLAEVLIRVADALGASTAEVIDIRSSTGLAAPASTQTSASGQLSGASLSIAA
jgi:transcriptional regulator with XRE-family HTH domain